MPIDKLTGLTFTKDHDVVVKHLNGLTFTQDDDVIVHNFMGLSFQYLENLKVTVVDQSGNILPSIKISIQRNGSPAEEYWLSDGVFFEMVETSTDYIITAIETETYIPISEPQVFTFDGSISKTVTLEMRKAFYYHTIAKKSISSSSKSSIAKLKKE